MDIRQIRYFLAIVDHGGFGRAAEHLRVAQPSLSQSIAGLERDLGAKLFHRLSRGVVLSPAGSALVEPARSVMRGLRTAREAVESVDDLLRGTVELVTMPAPGIEPLATLTRRLRKRHPGLALRAGGAFAPGEVITHLKQGAYELGLVGVTGPIEEPGLTSLLLEDQPFSVIGAPWADIPDGEVVSPAILAGADVIESPSSGTLMRRIVDDLLRQDADVHIVAEVSHRTSLLPLVLDGVGLAIVPSAWAPMARRAGARIAELDLPARLSVVLLARDGVLSAPAQAFLAEARAYRPADYFRTSIDSADAAEVQP
ncbi:LysR family transcriptional regulator [Nocardia sp. CA-290969]|uniref:LysR family transcriptional regulator n=1 Tax=Nocardia sp. CA-290969 TaxID=3239986 RepID=UPI003D8D435D